jgi:hypothetical protein
MKSKKIILIALSSFIFVGCYAHYPSIGVKNNRVRPTDWAGRRIITQCKNQKVPRCYKYNLAPFPR